MKLRVLALLALCGALVPVWASEVITHEMRINRQRITTVLNAPGAVLPPQTCDVCLNRQRITTIYDMPGMIRNALPVDPQIDRRRFDQLPAPQPYVGPRFRVPTAPGKTTAPQSGVIVPKNGLVVPPQSGNTTPKAPVIKEEVRYLQDVNKDKPKDKVIEGKDKPVDRDRCLLTKLNIVDWKCGRQFKDDKGRVWHLIQGTPQSDKPNLLEGWMLQASDSPIYFFSKTGRMWRMISIPITGL